MVTTIIVYDQFTYLWNFAYATYCVCMGNYDTSTWPAPMDLSVPFDKSTIIGWYSLTFILMCMDLTYLISLLLGTTHFIACCIYIAAICEHHELVLRSWQENIEQNQREADRQKFEENSAKIREQIKGIVQIHMEIFE